MDHTWALPSPRASAVAPVAGPGVRGPFEGRAAAGMLQGRLARELPLELSVSDSLPAVLGRGCDELAPYRGRSMAGLLFDPDADVAALAALKQYAKQLAVRSRADVSRGVATTLYYAAIASALVFRATRITQHEPAALRRAFAALVERPWVPEDLKALFARARDACRN